MPNDNKKNEALPKIIVKVYEEASSAFLFPYSKAKTPREKKRKASTRDPVVSFEKLKKLNDDFLSERFFDLYSFPASSFQASQWVFRTPKLTKNDLLVELMVASFYDSNKGYAYPTQIQLSKLTGLTVPKVRESISRMKASGRWLVSSATGQDAFGRSSRYYLLPPFGYGLFFKESIHLDNPRDIFEDYSLEPENEAQKLRGRIDGRIIQQRNEFQNQLPLKELKVEKRIGRWPALDSFVSHWENSSLNLTSYQTFYKKMTVEHNG